MPTVYVYAPVSGTVIRCNTSAHCPCTDSCPCGGCYAIDISASAGTQIKLYVNYPYIKSVYWEEDTSGSFECCDGVNVPIDLKRALRVHLYADYNYGCYVGWVLFGHIDPTGRNIQNGNISSREVGVVGRVPSGSGYSCYSGPHVHMEVAPSWGYAFSCGSGVTVSIGYTAIYYRSYSTCPV
jgi:hypothetical protein